MRILSKTFLIYLFIFFLDAINMCNVRKYRTKSKNRATLQIESTYTRVDLLKYKIVRVSSNLSCLNRYLTPSSHLSLETNQPGIESRQFRCWQHQSMRAGCRRSGRDSRISKSFSFRYRLHDSILTSSYNIPLPNMYTNTTIGICFGPLNSL